MQLSAFQDAFAAALQDVPAAAHTAPSQPAWIQALMQQPGFAVYRNNGRKASLDALRANYPTVAQLVGDDWFLGAAHAFVAAHPPTDGRLMDYGQGFAAFLAGFAPAAELPYLVGVASLDRAWTQAHLAADAPALQADWMASLTAETLATARIAPHPAAQWQWCEQHPAYSIWQRHRDGAALEAPLQWRAEGALLTRPGAQVQWCALPPEGVAFMNACAGGATLEAAAAAAMAPSSERVASTEETPDLARLMALLLTAGALLDPEQSKQLQEET